MKLSSFFSQPSGVVYESIKSPAFWVDRLESFSRITLPEEESWQLFTVSGDTPVEIASCDSSRPLCFGSSESYQTPFPEDLNFGLINAAYIHVACHRTIQLDYPYIWQYWISGEQLDPSIWGLSSELEVLARDLERSLEQVERAHLRLSSAYQSALSLYALRSHIEAGEHWCHN